MDAVGPRSMSSLTGKRILSLIRDGDFAHPGEAGAVDLVLEGLPRDPSLRVLDLGCGLGGTAALIAQRGHQHVTGVDVDPDTIAYAQRTYPAVSFRCAGAGDVASALPGPFDAIVMFTSFYCFPDQGQALRACRALAHPGTEMRVFDYATPTWDARAQAFCGRYARGGHWQPLVLDAVDGLFQRNGWLVTSRRDFTREFRAWYRALVAQIDARRDLIIEASDEAWHRYARERYADLLAAIEDGTIGGAVVHASPR
jgi:cyclopropane fatty-acyl-phospholipid synthase-like methyltransferase